MPSKNAESLDAVSDTMLHPTTLLRRGHDTTAVAGSTSVPSSSMYTTKFTCPEPSSASGPIAMRGRAMAIT